MICKIWHVTLKRHWLPWMGQIVPYWREARTQTVELAVTVKVGSFEPGGLGQGGVGDGGSWETSPHLHPTERFACRCALYLASLCHEVYPRVLSF